MPRKRTGTSKRPIRKQSRGQLTHLGKGATKPVRKLETFPNANPERDTVVTFHCREFTCLCPITGQPDFAALEIAYIPDQHLLESKSLKLYLWTYRDVGIFHEDLVNELLTALVAKLKPRWLRVTGRFNARGGIAIDVTAEEPRRSTQATDNI